jgi:trk system potassium uptake protein TrkH
MSGITTTGSTIMVNLDDAPKAILLWRAMLQWLGGVGIILMAITLMPIMNVGGMQLFKVSSNDTAEKILPKSKQISIRLIIIYSVLTLLCAFFYKIFGMGFFDSLTHSMTTIATGGFSNYNESIGYFDSFLIEITSMIFILLGSIPFIAYIKFLNGDRKIFFSDTQIKTFFKIILFSIIILFIYLVIKNKSLFEISIRSISFNIISILTGTGYVTKDFDQWGNFSLIFFLILMFIGGCAGSTTCGIKIFRVQILYHFLVNQLKKIIYPRGIFIIKYDKSNIDDKFMSSVIAFIYLYIIIFFALTAILTLTGLNFVTAISGAATSISNVGPGLGDTIGPNGNFASLSNASKWALSVGMILGRLELFAILVLFVPSFWRKY